MPEPVRPTVLSLGQLLEKPPTAAPALVEPGLLPTQGILFVGGEPKVGKSLLVANLALALAAGEDRLGFTIPAPRLSVRTAIDAIRPALGPDAPQPGGSRR